MDNEVDTLPRTSFNRSPNQNEQTAAVFVEGGVRLRQFSPVKFLSQVKVFDLLIQLQPRKGLVHLA